MDNEAIRRVRYTAGNPLWMYGAAMKFIGPFQLCRFSWDRLVHGNKFVCKVSVDFRKGSRYFVFAEPSSGRIRKVAVYRRMPLWLTCRMLWWLLWSRPVKDQCIQPAE